MCDAQDYVHNTDSHLQFRTFIIMKIYIYENSENLNEVTQFMVHVSNILPQNSKRLECTARQKQIYDTKLKMHASVTFFSTSYHHTTVVSDTLFRVFSE